MDLNNQTKIREIISLESVDIEQMRFLVEEYIFEKKGKRVTINPFPPQDLGGIMRYQSQWNNAYWSAWEYFSNKLNGEKNET